MEEEEEEIQRRGVRPPMPCAPHLGVGTQQMRAAEGPGAAAARPGRAREEDERHAGRRRAGRWRSRIAASPGRRGCGAPRRPVLWRGGLQRPGAKENGLGFLKTL